MLFLTPMLWHSLKECRRYATELDELVTAVVYVEFDPNTVTEIVPKWMDK